MFRLDAFQFDRHLFSGGHIRPEVNITERTTPYLTPEAILLPHAELHFVAVGGVEVGGLVIGCMMRGRSRSVGPGGEVESWARFFVEKGAQSHTKHKRKLLIAA